MKELREIVILFCTNFLTNCSIRTETQVKFFHNLSNYQTPPPSPEPFFTTINATMNVLDHVFLSRTAPRVWIQYIVS